MTWAVQPDAWQRQMLRRFVGARRFAFNACCRNNTRLLSPNIPKEKRRALFTPFDNINWWNKWKRSPEALEGDPGKKGFEWVDEVPQEIFEEGVVDFGRAMTAWGKYRKAMKAYRALPSSSKKGKKPRTVGFPSFRSKNDLKQSYRLRQKNGRPRFVLRTEGLELPHLGLLRIRQSTRRARRRLRAQTGTGQAQMVQATVKYEAGKNQWTVTVVLKWKHDVVPAAPESIAPDRVLGCDVGITSLVTVASLDGSHHAHHVQPSSVKRLHSRTKTSQRALGLKRLASERDQQRRGLARRVRSKSETRARLKLSRRYARATNIRRYHMHALTNELVKTHDLFGVETLRIGNMMKNHCLAASIARQAWGEFFWQLSYKASWAGKRVISVALYFASTKRCCKCGFIKREMPLSERTFRCEACPWTADRDVNAAQNLAWYARYGVPVHGKYPVEHDKKPELAQAGARHHGRVTGLMSPDALYGQQGAAMVSSWSTSLARKSEKDGGGI
jgi:putative transposase